MGSFQPLSLARSPDLLREKLFFRLSCVQWITASLRLPVFGSVLYPSYQFPRAPHNKNPKPRTLIFSQFQKAEIQDQSFRRGAFSGGLSLACRELPSHLSSPGLSSAPASQHLYVLAPFLKGTPVRLHQAHLLNVPTPSKVTF